MQKNFDFCVVLFICFLVCGVLYVLHDHSNEYSVTTSNKVVTSRAKKSKSRSYNLFSHSNPASSNAGVAAVQSSNVVSSRGGSSSRVSHISAPSNVRSHNQAQSPSSSYLSTVSTSNTISSNGLGISVFDSHSKSTTKSSSSIVPKSSRSLVYVEMSKPLAYSGGVRHEVSSSNTHRSLLELSSSSYVGSGDVVVRQSARQSSVSAPSLGITVSSAYANATHGLSICGNTTPVNVISYTSHSSNIPQRAPSSGMGNPWLNWLDKTYDESQQFDKESAEKAWEGMLGDYWNEGMGKEPEFEDFWDWLSSKKEGHDKGDKNFSAPVGNGLPLFLMALAYMMLVFVFRRK